MPPAPENSSTPSERLFDPACGELAEYFLGDGASREDIADLAAELQENVEDWFRMRDEIAELKLRSIQTPEGKES